jgi:hypothetical protein
MSDWDHMGKAIDAVFSMLVSITIIVIIVMILTIPLAIWKVIDILRYVVS